MLNFVTQSLASPKKFQIPLDNTDRSVLSVPVNDTRQQILDTASQLFCGRGYELVGINEIIEKSRVAKATFYAHFRSKERLCEEWLKAEAVLVEKGNEALLKLELPVAEKVARKFDGLKKYVKNSEFRGCPFSITASMLNPDTEVRALIRDYKARTRLFWQTLASELRTDPAEAKALGDTLFLLYSGSITEAQNAQGLWPVDSAKAAALALCSTPTKR